MHELNKIISDIFYSDSMDESEIRKALHKFSEYDLKEQFPIEFYRNRKVLGKSFDSSELKGNKDNAYFVYKALTIADAKQEFSDKAASSFDPDNSSGKCDFALELYNTIWGFQYVYGFFGAINAFPPIENKEMLWGGDCLNSLQTTIYELTGLSIYKCIEQYGKNKEVLLNEMERIGISKMFILSHSPGNFGLVPAYFNGYRGTSPILKDYLPQSLYLLKECEKYDYKLLKRLENYTRNPKYRNGNAKLYFQEFSSLMFDKYINTMFLWDLVEYEDGKLVNVVDYNHKRIDSETLDSRIIGIERWCEGAYKFVKRRGLFLGALLYTQLFFKDEFSKIQRILFVPDSMVEENLTGLEAAIGKIIKNTDNEFVKKIFYCCKEEIINDRG